MPFIEETRARTQELFRQLLDQHRISSVLEVKAFRPADESAPKRSVEDGARWHRGLRLGFEYWINGEWDSTSWPRCFVRFEGDTITEADLIGDDKPNGAPPELIGQWWIAHELSGAVDPEALSRILRSDHYWDESCNIAAPATAATGYGLVAGALAEATDGIVASFDNAFDTAHNGESAEQFLSWWGDQQIERFGAKAFMAARQWG